MKLLHSLFPKTQIPPIVLDSRPSLYNHIICKYIHTGCIYTYISMRIRKGLLLSSSHIQTVSQTASDPQLNQPKTSHELHPIPTNHVEEKLKTYSKPSDPSHQPPFPDRPSKILLGCNRTNTSHTSGINQKVRYQPILYTFTVPVLTH